MLEWLMRNAVAEMLMPPGCLLLLACCGLMFLRRRPRLGALLLGLSVVLLYALSTRFLAEHLLHTLEAPAPDPMRAATADAIVVLGAGTYHFAPEYGTDTVNAQGLMRLRYAARLHRATGKPILVTGGSPEGAARPEAEHMAATLKEDFGVTAKWIEGRSRTTLENARYSRALLSQAGIDRVYVVTHAWHMPRAVLAFESAGFAVVPAATGHATRFRRTLLDFVPDAQALADSSRWFHEAMGLAWYRIQLTAEALL
jgi:uncharacterized SAM-binding protein YcdF (DUF218 family)